MGTPVFGEDGTDKRIDGSTAPVIWRADARRRRVFLFGKAWISEPRDGETTPTRILLGLLPCPSIYESVTNG